MNARITIKRGLWVLLSIGIWMPEVGRAQSGWTVEECMRYAVEHNFRIRNRRLDSKMARTDVAAGYGDFLPSIQITGASGKREGRSVDPRTNQYTSESFLENSFGLNLSLSLFEGFARINRLQFYKLNGKMSAFTEKMEENGVAFRVLEAFYCYCFDEKLYELAMKQRKQSERYYEQMLAYIDLGLRSRSDLQEVKARLQADIYQETVKSNNCRLSLLTLKDLMGLKDTDTLSVSVADGQGTPDASLSLSLDDLCASAESSLPEFNVMKMREEASHELVAVACGSLWPSVRMEFNLDSGYYDTEKEESGKTVPFCEQWNNNKSRYIGVCVSLPLFDGLSRLKNIRKEKLRLQQVRNENEQQRLSLYKEMHDTYFSFRATSDERLRADEQLRAAAITWEESEEKWKEGMVSVFELLEKRNRYMQAKAEVVRTGLQHDLKSRMVRFYQAGTFLE